MPRLELEQLASSICIRDLSLSACSSLQQTDACGRLSCSRELDSVSRSLLSELTAAESLQATNSAKSQLDSSKSLARRGSTDELTAYDCAACAKNELGKELTANARREQSSFRAFSFTTCAALQRTAWRDRMLDESNRELQSFELSLAQLCLDQSLASKPAIQPQTSRSLTVDSNVMTRDPCRGDDIPDERPTSMAVNPKHSQHDRA